MVQLLEELPPELQAHIAGTLDDAAAAGRWAQANQASRLLLLPRLDELLEGRRASRHSRLCWTRYAGCGVALRPRSASTIWAMAMLQSMCYQYHLIWTCTFACAALTTVSIQLALAAPTCGGTSLPECIGRPTDSNSTAWPLMRPHGAYLRMERLNELMCSREQQACSRHCSPVWLYNLLYNLLLYTSCIIVL